MNNHSEQAIEAYLDRLSAELQALPSELQRETREELRQHLHSLVARQSEPQKIVDTALCQFGDPREIGRRLAWEWEEDQWSLHGLTLVQRIDKIRAAGTLEKEDNKTSLLLKVANFVQLMPLLVACYLPSAAKGLVLGLHLSQHALHVASFGLLGLYSLVGLLACGIEWKEGQRRAASGGGDGRRMWRHIIARAGMSVLLPGMLILPQQAPLLGGALILLCLAPMMLLRFSPRTRLILKVSLIYGLLMGVVLGLVGTHVPAWLWLLLAPVFYMLGRWFWKRPLLWTKN